MSSVISIQSDGRIFLDFDALDDTNPCTDCGACCQHFRISFYFGELDSMPQGFVPTDLTSKLNDHYACMKNTESGGKPCIALQPGFGPGKQSLGCSIYENRPSVCREYQVWMDDGTPNPHCQTLRAQIGLPLLTPQVQHTSGR